MSDLAGNPPGRAQDRDGSRSVPRLVLKGLLLPMLPLLSLQRNTLPIIKGALQRDKDDYIKTIDKFALLEIHALLMVLDPARKLRARLPENIDKDLAGGLTQVLEKLANGLINVVEVQELVLTRLIDVLKEAKNEKNGNSGGTSLAGATDGLNGKSETNVDIILSRLANILKEAKNAKSGVTLEVIISRLADALNNTKNANNGSVSRLIETLRGRVIRSRLAEMLKEMGKGKREGTGNS